MLLLRAIARADGRVHDGLVAVRAAGLAAFASEVVREPVLTEEALRAHHAVVEAVHDGGACLPSRFGRTYADAAALREALAARAEELEAALDRIGGRVELGATLAWRADTPLDRSGGGAFLRSLAAREERRHAAEALAARLVEELHVERPHVRHGTCRASRIAVSLAILADRDGVNGITQGIADFARRTGTITATVYGPMAPYSFAS